MRGVTHFFGNFGLAHLFQLTRLMRGVTPESAKKITGSEISTHTPHARRDEEKARALREQIISTHTPHARRDYGIKMETVCNC